MKKIIRFLILILTVTISLFGYKPNDSSSIIHLKDTLKEIREVLSISKSTRISTDSDINTIVHDSEEVLEEKYLLVDGYYNTKEEVSLYIQVYGELPHNYITKREALEMGWQAHIGNLWDVTNNTSIGGDFYNREGLLPMESGRMYYTCDVNYNGGYRGEERIVFSNDGLIYYTSDHYQTFTLLYGDI